MSNNVHPTLWGCVLALNIAATLASFDIGNYEMAVFNGFVCGWLAFGLTDAFLRGWLD